MRAEFSHFGFEAPRTESLFFALFPPADAASRLSATAHQLCIRHRLAAAMPIATDRLHVSLASLGKHASLPRDLVGAAVAAAATMKAAAFEVTFDRAMSFLGGPRPLVLCGGEGTAGLVAFQQALGGAIGAHGLGRVKRQYTPHVTLLYDPRGIAAHTIEPIRWTVREFVLVHSLLGRSRHVPLGRWALRD